MSKKNKKLRPFWFKYIKAFLKLIIKKPEFKYLGEEIKDGSILLSNHVGAFGPLSLELYLNMRFRFWGTYEMNSNLISVYKYLANIYFYEKKHWNLTLSRLFCLIAAPVLWFFYRGLNLIPTYTDHRLKNTMCESIKVLQNKDSIVIFPEDSTDGYHDVISKFYPGFSLLAKKLYAKGIDTPIYVGYLKKKERLYIVDKAIKYSELVSMGLSPQQQADYLCDRVNYLGKLSF